MSGEWVWKVRILSKVEIQRYEGAYILMYIFNLLPVRSRCMLRKNEIGSTKYLIN